MFLFSVCSAIPSSSSFSRYAPFFSFHMSVPPQLASRLPYLVFEPPYMGCSSSNQIVPDSIQLCYTRGESRHLQPCDLKFHLLSFRQSHCLRIIRQSWSHLKTFLFNLAGILIPFNTLVTFLQLHQPVCTLIRLELNKNTETTSLTNSESCQMLNCISSPTFLGQSWVTSVVFLFCFFLFFCYCLFILCCVLLSFANISIQSFLPPEISKIQASSLSHCCLINLFFRCRFQLFFANFSHYSTV